MGICTLPQAEYLYGQYIHCYSSLDLLFLTFSLYYGIYSVYMLPVSVPVQRISPHLGSHVNAHPHSVGCMLKLFSKLHLIFGVYCFGQLVDLKKIETVLAQCCPYWFTSRY